MTSKIFQSTLLAAAITFFNVFMPARAEDSEKNHAGIEGGASDCGHHIAAR